MKIFNFGVKDKKKNPGCLVCVFDYDLMKHKNLNFLKFFLSQIFIFFLFEDKYMGVGVKLFTKIVQLKHVFF